MQTHTYTRTDTHTHTHRHTYKHTHRQTHSVLWEHHSKQRLWHLRNKQGSETTRRMLRFKCWCLMIFFSFFFFCFSPFFSALCSTVCVSLCCKPVTAFCCISYRLLSCHSRKSEHYLLKKQFFNDYSGIFLLLAITSNTGSWQSLISRKMDLRN